MTNTAISALPAATSANQADIVPVVQGGVTKQITRENLIKGFEANNYTEKSHSYGTVSTGTVIPAHDANGNNHIIDISGDITIETPTSSFSSGLISGTLELTGGHAHTITFGANWDWGDEGAPSLTSKSIIGYMRGYGDTLTKAWHKGGYS